MMENWTHHHKVCIVIPIIVALIGCYLVVAPIITDPAIEYLYTVGALVIGFFVYIPFVYYKYSFPCMGIFVFIHLFHILSILNHFIILSGFVTQRIQLLLNVGPPSKAAID